MSEEKKDVQTTGTIEATVTEIPAQDSPVLEMPTLTPEAPAAPAAPTLVLEKSAADTSALTAQKEVEDLTQRANLTPAEQKQVDDFAQQIDIHDTATMMQYGSNAQSKMVSFSENALTSVRTKDMGEIGGMLSGLVTQIKSFDVEEEKGGGLFGLFKKGSNRVTAMKARYSTAEANIAQIVGALEQHQVVLLKDIAMLDKMYEQNVVYFKELTMYILAGKKRLMEVRDTELAELRKKADASGAAEDAQAVNDLTNLCDRFEKKLYDLELTRTVSIQMAPQIRMIQNNDMLMSEKIQSTIVNTIPLWKSQMVLSLGVEHSNQAAQAQREVTDMTNELLRKNSEALKMATVQTARESERGVVDIETLQLTNRNLIETLDEVVRIQEEGRQRRHEAEEELARIEGELKTKLLEMRKS